MLEAGQPFPAFELTAHDGSPVTNLELRGAPHLVFYLPRPKSSASTAQACTFRDAWPQVQAAGLTVYGVTYDSPEDNRAFAMENRLPYLLLSDSDKRFAEEVDAKISFLPFPGRLSWLMDSEGLLRKLYLAVSARSHATQVLEDLQQLGLATTG